MIVALGLSPGLGFVHTGHELSFVYDVADLYKADISIPLSFEIASSVKPEDDIGRIARSKTRDAVVQNKLLSKAVHDIQYLLGIESQETLEADELSLWDDKESLVPYGVSYREFE